MKVKLHWLLGAGLLAGVIAAAVAVKREAIGEEGEKGFIGDLGGETDAGSGPAPAPANPSEAGTEASAQKEPSGKELPALDWLQDPELDALRMEVYKAELRARFLKATAEIREYEKRLSGKAVKEAEAPKPVAPPKPKPKLKLIAIDGKGAIVEVDGKTYSFSKPGDQEGKVTLKGVSSDRALIEVDGEDYEAKF